eukprot:Seg771.4 transcript_id=Seg771.4/GoldUCD/mRNA.D3Y31 product="hypothetical protein" protein_id=Seg771.4/GoldUCD/D3Y31
MAKRAKELLEGSAARYGRPRVRMQKKGTQEDRDETEEETSARGPRTECGAMHREGEAGHGKVARRKRARDKMNEERRHEDKGTRGKARGRSAPMGKHKEERAGAGKAAGEPNEDAAKARAMGALRGMQICSRAAGGKTSHPGRAGKKTSAEADKECQQESPNQRKPKETGNHESEPAGGHGAKSWEE